MKCTIHFTESSHFVGTAQLSEQDFAGYKFWFGVARIPALDQDFPKQFTIAFEDGRRGLVIAKGNGVTKPGVVEFPFLGISNLQ